MGKTLLLGLDGATFTVLDPLMRRGLMPFLSSIAEGGVQATLRTVVPPLTPPGWSSLVTGKRPGGHGVFDFFQKETPESEYFQFASSQDIHSATIWSLASDEGMAVIALNFPLMFPPPAVNGCVVPGGWMPWRQLRLGCHPPDLFDRLSALPSFNPRELALDMALEAKAIEGCADEEYADWIELHTRREERWLDIYKYLMLEEPADLVGVIFDGVDKLQHLCWRFLDPACQPAEPTAWEREIIERCENYFRQLDSIMEEMARLAGPDATVVLASDHGFGPSYDVFYVNAWLEQQGYLVWAEDAETKASEAPEIGFAQMTRHVYQLDWDRTVAYAATPSSQGIHIVAREPGTDHPMSEQAYQQLRARLARDLSEIRHPVSGDPLVREVWTRDEVFSGPYERWAPDLSVILDNGAAISILRSDVLFRQRGQPLGNHHMEGIFMASGPGIRKGVAVDELSIVDIAPLLLYTLDLPVPVDMQGCVPGEVFVEDEIRQRPPRSMAAPHVDGLDHAERQDLNFDSEDEAAILKRLRALGYVE